MGTKLPVSVSIAIARSLGLLCFECDVPDWKSSLFKAGWNMSHAAALRASISMTDSRPTKPDLVGLPIADFCARVQHFSCMEPSELSAELLLHVQELTTTRRASPCISGICTGKKSLFFFPLGAAGTHHSLLPISLPKLLYVHDQSGGHQSSPDLPYRMYGMHWLFTPQNTIFHPRELVN